MSDSERNIFRDLVSVASGQLDIANTEIAQFSKFAERSAVEPPQPVEQPPISERPALATEQR